MGYYHSLSQNCSGHFLMEFYISMISFYAVRNVSVKCCMNNDGTSKSKKTFCMSSKICVSVSNMQTKGGLKFTIGNTYHKKAHKLKAAPYHVQINVTDSLMPIRPSSLKKKYTMSILNYTGQVGTQQLGIFQAQKLMFVKQVQMGGVKSQRWCHINFR